MMSVVLPFSWPESALEQLEGRHVIVHRLQLERDMDDLYELSHGNESDKTIWTYTMYGPFADRTAMLKWITTLADPRIMQKLYEANSKSVKIRLIALGICSLMPGMNNKLPTSFGDQPIIP